MRPRLMIVEDNAPLAAMLAYAVRKCGWDAVSFEDPQQALEHFEVAEVDLVLTDLQLPGFDGIHFLARLRAAGWAGSAVIMTGAPHALAGRDLHALDMCALLVKPIGRADLARALGLRPAMEPRD